MVESVLAGLAVVAAVAVGVAATLTQPMTSHDPQLVGLLVALAVLLTCWTLLGVAVACCGRYLAAQDRSRWSADWARVEPVWSERR